MKISFYTAKDPYEGRRLSHWVEVDLQEEENSPVTTVQLRYEKFVTKEQAETIRETIHGNNDKEWMDNVAKVLFNVRDKWVPGMKEAIEEKRDAEPSYKISLNDSPYSVMKIDGKDVPE